MRVCHLEHRSENCPLSVLTGVRIKRGSVRENVSFSSEQTKLSGARIKRVSVERGFTVKSSIKPPGGAYLFQARLRGGLLERGGLFNLA